MKTKIYIILLCLIPVFGYAQSDSIAGNSLQRAKDSLEIIFKMAHKNAIDCQAKPGAILDSMCFVSLRSRLIKVSWALSEYTKLLVKYEQPTWINGMPMHDAINLGHPTSEGMEAIILKFDLAAEGVQSFLQARGTEPESSLMNFTVSDAMNSLCRKMGCLKK